MARCGRGKDGQSFVSARSTSLQPGRIKEHTYLTGTSCRERPAQTAHASRPVHTSLTSSDPRGLFLVSATWDTWRRWRVPRRCGTSKRKNKPLKGERLHPFHLEMVLAAALMICMSCRKNNGINRRFSKC